MASFARLFTELAFGSCVQVQNELEVCAICGDT